MNPPDCTSRRTPPGAGEGDVLLIPPEPGTGPEHLVGEPAGLDSILGEHVRGRGVWPVSHARFAIREAVRLLGLAPGEEVLMPAWCCRTVSEPVRAAGAVPVLCRVDRRGGLDWQDVADRARSPRARALVLVHYLGLPADLATALQVCEEHRLVLIEDCAHALFSRRGSLPVGRTAPLAVFSIRKTLPVGLGGALTVDEAAFPLPADPMPEPPPDSPRGRLIRQVRELYLDFGRAVRRNRSLLHPDERARLWRRMRLLYASWTPAHTLPASAGRVLAHIDPEEVVRRRRENFLFLLEHLHDWALFEALPEGVCPLGFPVLVADRSALRRALEEAGVGYLIHWERDLLPPGAVEVCPWVASLAEAELTLPVHQDLTIVHLEYLVERFRRAGVKPLSGLRGSRGGLG